QTNLFFENARWNYCYAALLFTDNNKIKGSLTLEYAVHQAYQFIGVFITINPNLLEDPYVTNLIDQCANN
ncbi:MAG: hypothetical protein LBV46_00575, partial [Bacteroidales bacterium]|nr:hypothetical protein [Bacteroidales bacterium]